MYPGTTDCYKLCSTYSYVANDMRMARFIHVLCACGLLQGLHGGAVLVIHLGHSHSPLTLTHLIHEYQPGI
jgi:hypothetical protein